ncbi:uncharacterized protein CCOS01_13495 [Colletotrichum costaricense]|uniref:Uncharacterized protein n=1 Tax=Colletotrichum costaricense TaxID=1209916 RepID=A0AAJ0DVT7_9PEZI|nr:uncharacterized protein CCOS01_13495 [Colletotrichum costaricense]KAK1515302.1 hypothetical protein CCOS01_13495 [Colletotrichum costaricense]
MRTARSISVQIQSHQSRQLELNSTSKNGRDTWHVVPGDPYCPKPTSPGRPIPPGLIWWSPKGPGLCSLALPLDGLVRKGTARYRSSNGAGRKLHTSNGASQPASPAKQQVLPQSLPGFPSAAAVAAAEEEEVEAEAGSAATAAATTRSGRPRAESKEERR